jgi:hypothetical protein
MCQPHCKVVASCSSLTVDGWCVFCQFFFFLPVSQALNKNKMHHTAKLFQDSETVRVRSLPLPGSSLMGWHEP